MLLLAGMGTAFVSESKAVDAARHAEADLAKQLSLLSSGERNELVRAARQWAVETPAETPHPLSRLAGTPTGQASDEKALSVVFRVRWFLSSRCVYALVSPERVRTSTGAPDSCRPRPL